MRIRLFHVDAFTNQTGRGNPAAVCLLDSWLDDEALRKVAAENNLSATAFVAEAGNHLDLRWFTPRCEIRLCGHATLAAAFVSFTALHPGLSLVQFSTRFSGVLTVQKDGDLLAMDFPAFTPRVVGNVPDGISRALGLESQPLDVLAANDSYLVVLDSEAAVWRLRPDFALLEQLHPYAVSVTAPADKADFVSRYFAPSYGVPEDPVTGSAHCILTPYWAKRLGKLHLHARQLSERGGELWCEVTGERVIVKGAAVLTMQGTVTI